MKATPNRPLSIAASAIGFGLFLALAFNSCSDVSFSNKSNDTVQNPQCQPPNCPPTPDPTPTSYTDTFNIPKTVNKADILLVLDNSGSMEPDLAKLADKLDGLIEILDKGGVDWRMCYTKTGVTTDPNRSVLEWKATDSSGNVVQTGARVLTPATADKRNIFLTTIDHLSDFGTGSSTEQGIASMGQILKSSLNRDCFRDDSALATVVISDEDEKSCGGRCADYQSSENPSGPQYWSAKAYTDQYRAMSSENQPETLVKLIKDMWSEKSYVHHSIVVRKDDYSCYDKQDSEFPAFFGLTYSRLQSLTGGILGDICADSYATQLQSMGERIRDAINSVTLRCMPDATPPVQVTVSPALPTGVTWSSTGNKILFSSALPEGSQVVVKYNCSI
jgi:hypothetical protein